jgi:hypothetical protein
MFLNLPGELHFNLYVRLARPREHARACIETCAWAMDKGQRERSHRLHYSGTFHMHGPLAYFLEKWTFSLLFITVIICQFSI